MQIRRLSCATGIFTLLLILPAFCCGCSKPEQPPARGPAPAAGASSKGSQSEPVPIPNPSAKPSEFLIANVAGKDLSKFDHHSSRHKTAACKTCHERRDNTTTPRRPAHDACIQCHSNIFTIEEFPQKRQFCELCHKSPIDPAQIALVDFPKQLRQFGIKEFLHHVHLDGKKMTPRQPELNCKSCHKVTGQVLQVDYPAHKECYACHTPTDERAGGDCGVCHAQKEQALPFRRLPRPAFSKFGFQHVAHMKQAKIAGDCEKCHKSIETAAGVDISGIAPRFGMRHSSQCWTCHKREREPSCTKCHRDGLPITVSRLGPPRLGVREVD